MQTIAVEPKSTVAEPTVVTTGVNYTVPAAASYLLLVTATVPNVVITIPSRRSYRVINVGTNAAVVDVITANNVTLNATQAVDVMWDSATSGHRTFLLNTVSDAVVAANSYATMYQSAHGYTSSNAGYCLFGHAIYDDTSATEAPTGVFVQQLNANEFKFAAAGQSFTLPAAMISGSYSIGTNGRFLFWDKSASAWKATKPSDSAPTVGAALQVNSYDSTSASYNCTVMGFTALGG